MNTLFSLEKKPKWFALICLGMSCVLYSESKAQGCSDAGFCSVGALKSESTDSTTDLRNKLGITLAFGEGDNDIFIFTPALFYERQIHPKWTIQTKLTANYAKGSLGEAFGLGDLIQSISYEKKFTKKVFINYTVGVKFPLNNSNQNQNQNGRSLPMTYQSSLGTLDLIAGVVLKIDRFKASFGMQVPVSNLYATDKSKSANGFIRSEWDSTLSDAYPSTNGFRRSPDMLLKIEYHFKIGKKLVLTPGLLAIYHLKDDRYQASKEINTFSSISGSKGLTLNVIAVSSFKLNKHFKASITFGTPLIFRNVRPDGLTRHFILAPEISYLF